MSGAIVSGPGTMKSTLCRLVVHLLQKYPLMDAGGTELKIIYASFGEPEVPQGATVISPEYLSDFEDFFKKNSNSIVILDSLRPLDVLSGPLGSKGRNKAMGQRLTYLDRIAYENRVALFMVFNPNDEPDCVGNYYSTFKSSINYVLCSDDTTTNEALTKQLGKKCRGFKYGEALYSVRAWLDRSDNLLVKTDSRGLLLSMAKLVYNLIREEVSSLPSEANNSGSYNCLLSFGIARPASTNTKERLETLSSAVQSLIAGITRLQAVNSHPGTKLKAVNSLLNEFSNHLETLDDDTLVFKTPLPSFQERVNEIAPNPATEGTEISKSNSDEFTIDGFEFSEDDFTVGEDVHHTRPESNKLNKDHF